MICKPEKGSDEPFFIETKYADEHLILTGKGLFMKSDTERISPLCLVKYQIRNGKQKIVVIEKGQRSLAAGEFVLRQGESWTKYSIDHINNEDIDDHIY